MGIRRLKYPQFWWDTWYKVKCFFKPEQEWLTDVIPDTYCDKVELIPTILFKCLTHYVEVELKSDHVADLEYDWAEDVMKGHVPQEYADNQIKIQRDLLKAYKWITEGRPEIEEKINSTYPPVDLDSMLVEREDGHYDMKIPDDVKECYDKIDKLEATRIKKDTEAMRIIVKYHQTLWT